MDKFIKEKVRVTLENLKKISQRTILDIEKVKYLSCSYKKGGELPGMDDCWKKFGLHDRVGGKDCHYWFYTEIKTPDIQDDEELLLEITVGHDGTWDIKDPQGILYLNGEIVQGMDINHTMAYLKSNTDIKVLFYLYTGMNDSQLEVKFDVKLRNKLLTKFYYDIKVPYDAAMCFDEDDYNHIRTIKYLEQACNLIDFRDIESNVFKESIKSADDYLISEYYEKECGKSDAVVSYVGHTHIDVAWLWTLKQTKEKVQRTFSTVLTLMDKYPEYIFMSSQPQLYEYLKEAAPELYERVKQKIKEGRWEVEGAMWLEADCNLSSGESLVRQIIYGKRFMREEFGVDSKILWLPDVFGYSAALPQILKKSGVNRFVTSKISWNETNTMPYDTFMWEGIDGTEIFSYFLTAQNHEQYKNHENYTKYNGTITPEMNLGTWERYQQKEYSNETIVTFGYGDGGGGPTEEMIETERRLEYGIPGMPKAQMSFVGDFLKRVEDNFCKSCHVMNRTPKWVGELYLELHRGTYTSIAKNKRNNRKSELLCQESETVAVIDKVLNAGSYPQEELNNAWKTILLNQFHDIIPGSSIFEVYEESDRQYAELQDKIKIIRENKLQDIADNISKNGIMVYNPNAFKVSGYVDYNGDVIYAKDVPSLGWKVITKDESVSKEVVVNKGMIDSPYYKILFDEYMNIISLFDIKNNREVIVAGKVANELYAFEDYPKFYDNWEISNYYKQKKYEIRDVSCVNEIRGNGFGGFEILRKYMNSTIKQRIIVYSENRRIDFENEIDWHEHQTLLKAVFPVDIHTNKATYDIQFGNVERPNYENTSWETAKFEVCAHKWVDLSEDDYGVSILNDCKYGHSILGNEMTITLIKCGTYPNPKADQGMHIFTYSLYPHNGNFKTGGTIEAAYFLNKPLIAFKVSGKGELPAEYSLIKGDCENVIIETVKEAENGHGIVIRMYEAWNKKSVLTLNLGFNSHKISICDMLEKPQKKIGAGNKVVLEVSNYEIVTLLIEV